jgi:hypothetical protein
VFGITKCSITYIPLETVDSFTGIALPISDTESVPTLCAVVGTHRKRSAVVGLENGETKWDMTERDEPPKGRGAFESIAWAQ